jgi:hypothetical protein
MRFIKYAFFTLTLFNLSAFTQQISKKYTIPEHYLFTIPVSYVGESGIRYLCHTDTANKAYRFIDPVSGSTIYSLLYSATSNRIYEYSLLPDIDANGHPEIVVQTPTGCRICDLAQMETVYDIQQPTGKVIVGAHGFVNQSTGELYLLVYIANSIDAMSSSDDIYSLGKVISIQAPGKKAAGLSGFMQNSPNPFNPRTIIEFNLTAASPAEMNIYSIDGMMIKTFKLPKANAGFNQVIWEGNNNFGLPVSAGTYYYQLKQGNQIIGAKTMLLLK